MTSNNSKLEDLLCRKVRKLAENVYFGQNPINVNMLTMDADGCMFDGFSEVVKDATGVTTTHFLDTLHLKRSVSRAISNSKLTPKLATDIPCGYAMNKT